MVSGLEELHCIHEDNKGSLSLIRRSTLAPSSSQAKTPPPLSQPLAEGSKSPSSHRVSSSGQSRGKDDGGGGGGGGKDSHRDKG